MESVIEQGTLFPLVEERTRKPGFLRELRDVQEVQGPLLARAWIPLVVDLSRQRVKVLIDEGRLVTVKVRGREFVTIASLEGFLALERKAGRPVSELSMVQSFRNQFKKSEK